MEIKRRILITLIIALFVIFTLGGCQKKSEDKDNKGEKVAQEKSTNETLVLKVDKQKVNYNEVMLYVLMLKQEYEPSLGKEIWSFDKGDGKTFEDEAKEEVISEITQLKIICQKAGELGITLNEDEMAEVKEIAKAHLEEIASEDADKYGITLDVIEKIYEEHSLAKKTFDTITLDVDTEVSDEDAKQITVNQIYIATVTHDKDGNEIKLDDKEKAKALKKVKTLLKEAKKTEDFAAFAEKNTQHNQVQFTFGKGEAGEVLEKVVFALKTGEISGIITLDNGYYILECVSDFDEDATAIKKEEIIADRQKKEFAKVYKDWSKEFEVTLNTTVWDTVTFAE